MRTKYDYSEYERSEYEKYLALRQGYRDITFDYFRNRVYYRPDRKDFLIEVDDYHEDFYMDELYEEIDGPRTEEEKAQDLEDSYGEDGPPTEPDADDAAVLTRFRSVFDIRLDHWFSDYRTEYPDLNNVLSGTTISLSPGDGLLDFCYADFSEAIEKSKAFYFIFSEDFSSIAGGEPPEPEQVHSRTEEIILTYQQFADTMLALKKILYRSLYTAIFPPVIFHQTKQAFYHYVRYIKVLQEELLELIEFCFDEHFYPKVLGALYPSERFGLYCQIKNRSSSFTRTERFRAAGQRMSGLVTPFGMPKKEIIARMGGVKEPTEEHLAFAERFGMEPEKLKYRCGLPLFISTAYEVENVYDMLYLEFTKMLEQNIRFKKCERCGKYFILKGNYQTAYCDRVAEGETRSCQQLAALEHYHAKLRDNGPWGAYNKYYKRYFARAKVGTIKPPVFKQWQYEAVVRRDQCVAGELPLDEYTAWLDGSFPNRSKKQR